ncbi:MAG: polysaccharide deacetylase family protein [Acidobacteriaceae bacterium]|nr:polysaccharide deacetylase family protein [Acidobacteriaceae bacterium]
MTEPSISLLYHDIVQAGAFSTSGFPGADAGLYKLEEPAFRAHLDAIAARGIRPSARLFTFDDGGASALRAAAVLQERGWRGYFFIATDYIGRPGFLDTAQIRSLAAGGHIIGSHTCSHPLRMSALSHSALLREWSVSRGILSDIVGQPASAASVPGGYYSRLVAETAADTGFTELFTSEPVSRVDRVNGMRVFGRYSVQQHSPAATVGAIAAGAVVPRLQQYVYWNAKKLIKRVGGQYWLHFRKYYLNVRHGGSK